MNEINCWCGNGELNDFSPDYKLCPVCNTLVYSITAERGPSEKDINKNDFYGYDYWFEYLPRKFNYPDLNTRSRYDLSERVLYWLRSILKYNLPPGKALELGSAHGGFVALLRQVGFDAAGLEISPWVVQFAEEHFQIPMYLGPIENQTIDPGSLDFIVMMDVLEHLPDPLATMKYCLSLLKPDGRLFIQTPEYDGNSKYSELMAKDHIFLKQLKPFEHIFLFSRASIKEFLNRLDIPHVSFLPPCFNYDMFVVASRTPILENTEEEIEHTLLSTSERRITLALLDINRKCQELEARLAESDADRHARLKNIHKLQILLDESEADRKSRLDQIHEIEALLMESERDRSARLDVINDLSMKIDQIDMDRSKLGELLKESEADRLARMASIQELEKLLAESEADRKAGLDSIHELEILLEISEADHAEKLSRIFELEGALKQKDEENEKEIFRLKNDLRSLIEDNQKRELTINDLQKVLAEYSGVIENLEKQNRNQTLEVHHQAYYIALYEHEINRFPLNFIRRFQNKYYHEKEKLVNRISSVDEKKKTKKLNRIAVDLTPVLPGGENGGAKLLATSLVWQFSRKVAPHCEYILLTSDDSDQELSWLDAENVRRVCVNFRSQEPNSADDVEIVEDSDEILPNKDHKMEDNVSVNDTQNHPSQSRRSGLRKIVHSIGVSLENVLPRSLYRKIYMLYKADFSGPRAGSIVSGLNADILFCPFTAPYYHSPGIPTVIVVHDLQYQKYPQYFTGDELCNTDIQFKKSCQFASRLICVSDHTRESVLQSSDISADRVRTIHTSFYNPLERIIEDVAEDILDQYHLEKKNYLFYPANFWKHKNHDLLLTAFNIYINRNPSSHIKLVMTGAPGERMDFLKDASQRMGIGDHVVFPGFVDEETLSVFFQNCLAVIFPSLYEGFGVPVLEAMSFDVPVLCSNLTSLPEVGGDAVHYFDPRKPREIIQAMDRVITDRTYRENLVRKGKSRVNVFMQPEQWAKQYFDEFTAALHENQITTNQIYGLYSDHWAGGDFELTIKEGDRPRFLELNLEVPGWIRSVKMSVMVYRNDKRWKRIVLKRRKRNIVRLPISRHSYRLKFKFSIAIQPSQAISSKDDRYLSCRVIWIRLLTEDAAISIYESGL